MDAYWMTMIGLVGLTLVVSGSNVLPDFRGWCQGFHNPWQPLRWIGVGLEFVGIVTDKSMATGFCIGIIWWSGPRPWPEVLLFAGQLTVASAVADSVLALLQALLRRAMGGGMVPPPMTIPRGTGLSAGVPRAKKGPPLRDGTLRSARRSGPLLEDEAFDALDEADGRADEDRGAITREGGEG